MVNKGFESKIVSLDQKSKEHLNQLLGINRLIWNTCLGYKKELWDTYKRRHPCVDNKEELYLINQLGSSVQLQKNLCKKRIMELESYDFIMDCPANAVQQCIRKLDNSFSKFFKGKCNFPKFKKKNGENSILISRVSSIKKINKNYLKITTNKMTFIFKNPIKGNLKIFDEKTKICHVVLKRKTDGQYYISVNYSYEQEKIKKRKIKSVIGIDRGITTTATLSDGQLHNLNKDKINNINKRIKFLQKKMSKKNKGSANRNKIRIKIAKLYAKKKNIKKDFNHKLSSNLVKKYDLIVMENLNIRNMTKSSKGTDENPGKNVSQKSGLNRMILDNNWGQLKQFIEYKCEWSGKVLVLVDPRNTSQKCSKCNYIHKENREEKQFSCLRCGYKCDADVNAAINIKEAGLALFAGGGISLEIPMKQELETTTL
jgi:putative transposase